MWMANIVPKTVVMNSMLSERGGGKNEKHYLYIHYRMVVQRCHDASKNKAHQKQSPTRKVSCEKKMEEKNSIMVVRTRNCYSVVVLLCDDAAKKYLFEKHIHMMYAAFKTRVGNTNYSSVLQ